MVLTFKPGRNNKIHIFLDGEYSATTSAEYWYSLGISQGAEISIEDWDNLLFEIEARRVYARALNLLEMRDHSRRELKDKLYKKCAPGATDKKRLSLQIENVCDKLEELGLLDDLHFATLYAEEVQRRKHLSPRGLRSALSQKGISREIIDAVISELSFDSKSEIITLLNTKYKNRDLTSERDASRTINALMRLGYSYSEIKEAIGDYTNMEYFSDSL